MRTFFSLFAFLLMGNSVVFGQNSVLLEFSRYADQSVVLTLKKGMRADTVFSGVFNSKGSVKITLPKTYDSYRGVAALKAGKQGEFEFLLAGENLTLRCSETQVNNNNVVFVNSVENTALQNWLTGQQRRREKLKALAETLKVYTEDEPMFQTLKSEQQSIEKEQSNVDATLDQSQLYAAKYIRLYNFLNDDVGNILRTDDTGRAAIRQKMLKELDLDNLYTSGLWFRTINGLLALYVKESPYHVYFIPDMWETMYRTQSEKVYTAFAENIVEICETLSWTGHSYEFAQLLSNDNRITEPKGILKKFFTAIFKVMKGSVAPELSLGKMPQGNRLLAFLQDGCGHCERELNLLKQNYTFLKNRGYDVVTVMADTDTTHFLSTAAQLPWETKYCAITGFESVDFQTYGVIGTPTLYVIDEKGIIQGRYAQLEDTGLLK
ncbi:MAG: redoxin domain-containing protein [Prevotellaceae bacterium]|jgi:hypothetical protein|nr:redoxin domain-containing protein [Prevotellaceae bacterium]